MALAVVAVVGAALTVVLPDLLNGTPVMNGSARGTAFVMLVAGVPSLVAVARAPRVLGQAHRSVLWLGTLGYFVYNSLLFLFATPFNELFLVYVAMMALSIAAVGVLVLTVDSVATAVYLPARTARGVAFYLWVIVAGNTVIWLTRIMPGLAHADAPDFLRGTGLITNPIFVQDLAFWLPLGALAAFWLWRNRPWGVVIGGGYLAMWVLEGLSVAVDQWFGSAADPRSDVVSPSLVLPFVVLSMISLAILAIMLRALRGTVPQGTRLDPG